MKHSYKARGGHLPDQQFSYKAYGDDMRMRANQAGNDLYQPVCVADDDELMKYTKTCNYTTKSIVKEGTVI